MTENFASKKSSIDDPDDIINKVIEQNLLTEESTQLASAFNS